MLSRKLLLNIAGPLMGLYLLLAPAAAAGQPLAGDPVAVVQAKAGRLGFSGGDRYSLVSLGDSQALVQVDRGGAKYIAVVDRIPDGEWAVSYSYKLNH